MLVAKARFQSINLDSKIMIFLSYSQKDKHLISQIASVLKDVYGQEKVFFDAWSIKPGDSIIGEMNRGLEECQYFFFFISQNSLQSKMVELEWQSALIKKAKESIKFIPVKVDNCIPPQILLSTLYINLFQNGLDNATRQIVDIINGTSSYTLNTSQFSNLKCHVTYQKGKILINIQALYYVEPHPGYVILFKDAIERNEIQIKQPGAYWGGEAIIPFSLNTGEVVNGLYIKSFEATSPGFPFTIELEISIDKPIMLFGIMKEISQGNFQMLPCEYKEAMAEAN